MLALLFTVLMQMSTAAADPGALREQEMRGIWVTRWTYSSQSDVQQIMKDVAAAGFNTVYFQVRGQHDAFYDSSVEPWAAELTGTLGSDPGWDPLQVAVETGHKLGLEVHAYINAFTLWRGVSAPPESKPSHAWNTDGDWVVADADGMPMTLNDGYVYASPGNPAVRARLATVAADIATRYKVDGIHLDHIRYPGPEYGHDLESLSAWEAEGRPDFSDWRRAKVNEAVRAVQAKVQVPVSAAVWGVYTNTWGWAEVSEGRNAYFQDSAAFSREGLVDALIPMIYWKVNPGGRLDFGALVRDHVSRANGRHVYAGIRAEPTWGVGPIVEAIKAAREGGANGVVLFEYSEAKPSFETLKATVFQVPADPPAMDWR